MAVSYSIMVKRKEPEGTFRLSLNEIATQSRVHPEMIARFVRLGLIDPVVSLTENEDPGEWIFPAETVGRIRRILRLRYELGVNFAGIGVLLDLLSRLEKLESRLRYMEEKEERRNP